MDGLKEADSIAPRRLMPDPAFVGSPLATTVAHVLPREDHRRSERPLVEGERRLGWFILPPFQRPPVWTDAQKTRLIESIWLRLPIGSFFYNEGPMGHHTDGWLIDGQQRVTALLGYVAGDYPVFGYRFPDLPRIDQRSFEMSHFPCVQLQLKDADQLRDIYDRLAYGGTAHEPPQ